MSEAWKQSEGQLVDGKFPLRQYLGGSESSAVFLTERAGAKAAIKFIQVDDADAEQQLSRWKAAAHLFHTHLLRVFDSGRCRLGDYEVLYVVMECAQENLGQFLSQRPLTPAEMRDVLEPVLDALAYLHREGFVHGHIRPSNIFAIDDEVKLSSDGLLRLTESSEGLSGCHEESLHGTTPLSPRNVAPYDSPEAARGEISSANDVWSLGMTIVEALTQHLPALPDAPSSSTRPGDPAVPETLPVLYLDIARHCLCREPHRRWSIAEIAARLNPASAAASAGTVAKPLPTSPVLPRVSQALTPREDTYQVPAPRQPLYSQTPAPRDHYTKPRYELSPPRLKRPPLMPRVNYFILGFVSTLVLLAVLILPKLFGHRGSTEQASSIEPASPVTQKAPVASVRGKTQPKSVQKSPTTPSLSSTVPSSSRPVTPANAKQPISSSAKETAKTSPAVSSPAALRSAAAPSIPVTSSAATKPSSNAIASGEVLDQVLPEVPQKAQATIHGTVRTSVKLHVDAAGNVTGAELSSTGPSKYFADLALNAARRWDFAPAKRDGHNVPSDWLVRFEFTQTATRVFPTQATP